MTKNISSFLLAPNSIITLSNKIPKDTEQCNSSDKTWIIFLQKFYSCHDATAK